ncbi:putative zinc protease [Candidatus Vecturithrix granuli]|uniref:Putative zinc protease n=1 Tax=Vecturithrix granuli TaxID=1499967 RepID=A0A081BYN5_VECG1|nr:putative zinc protease [Candidatus Vecturithrix granuli]
MDREIPFRGHIRVMREKEFRATFSKERRMARKTLHISEVGTVILIKSQRATRLTMTLRPFQDVRVTVPKGMTFAQAEAFVNERMAWIQRHQPKIQTIERKYTIFDEQTSFRTREHELRIIRSDARSVSVRTVKGEILVTCPVSKDIHADDVQRAIREGIERAWRKEAKAYLPQRVKILSEQHGLVYQQLRIKNTQSRWGSCSQENNINLSLHVMRLPDPLIDYVILHELVHTVEKNHGSQFWKRLAQVCQKARKLDKELKKYNIKIY